VNLNILTRVSSVAPALMFVCTIVPASMSVKNGFAQNPQDLVGHQRPAKSLAFSPDGKMLASGSEDGTIRFWDIPSGQPRAIIRAHTMPVLAVRFSPDGKTIASGSLADGLKLWNVGDGSVAANLPLPPQPRGLVSSLVFTSDGKKLAAGVGHGNRLAASRSELFVWELPSGTQLHRVFTAFNEGPLVALTADETELVLASGKKTAVYDLVTGKERPISLSFNPGFATAMALSPNGTVLALGKSDKVDFQGQKIDKHQIKLYQFATGQELVALEGHEGLILCLAFTPEGKRIVSGSRDGTVRLWDVASGQVLATLMGNIGYVHCLAISPNGKILAAGGQNGTIQLWNLPTP